jgi:hypothetical protein
MRPHRPAGLAATDASLYVGDPAGARIIQISRSGTFERALSADTNAPLAALKDLTVSADGQALFVLSDRTIFRFALPK